MKPLPSRIWLIPAGALAGLAVFFVIRGGGANTLAALACAFPPLLVGLLGGRDAQNEWEQQAAFEEAERGRAEARAGVIFDSFIDACPVAVEIYATNGKLVRSNKAADRLLGKVPPPGLSLFDPNGLKRAGLLEPQLKRVLAGTRVETPPTWYDPTDIGLPGIPGTKVCFRATIFPLFDFENEVIRIAVLHEDVTETQGLQAKLRQLESAPAAPAESAGPPPGEDIRDLEFRRRKIEQSLRESEERYRALVENARGFVVLRFAEDGRVAAISPSVRETWGISADTIITDSSAYYAQVVPEDIGRVRETEARVRETGTWPDQYRFRVRNKDTGEVRWVELRGSVGTALGRRTCDAVAFDVTRLLEVEQQLIRRQSSLDSIVGSTTDAVVTLDTEFKVASWSPAAEAATGFRATDAVGKPITELYPDFEKTGFLSLVRKTLHDQKIGRLEAFYQDGREPHAGWFNVTSYPFETGVLLLIRNTTEQHRVEAAWRESESRLRSLLAAPGLAVSLKDRDLHYRLANAAALRTLGLAEGATVENKTDENLLKPAVADLLAGHDRQAMGQLDAVEVDLALPDAIGPQSSWYKLVKTAFRDLEGNVTGVLTIAWDISRQVYAQQELARRRSWLEKLVTEHATLIEGANKELKRWQG